LHFIGLEAEFNALKPENFEQEPLALSTSTDNDWIIQGNREFNSSTIKINPEYCKLVNSDQFEFRCNKEQPKTEGKASWYDYSLPDYPSYSKENYTAASRDYPKGTMLRVCKAGTNPNNIQVEIDCSKKSEGVLVDCVIVRVNDYVENPDVIIDLSSKAFSELAPLSRGIIDVEITKL